MYFIFQISLFGRSVNYFGIIEYENYEPFVTRSSFNPKAIKFLFFAPKNMKSQKLLLLYKLLLVIINGKLNYGPREEQQVESNVFAYLGLLSRVGEITSNYN